MSPRHTLDSLLARSIPVPIAGCFIWEGGLFKSGYGKVSCANKSRTAHRFAKALELNRELLPHEVVRHTCDVYSCINPKHLVLGTFADNSADMVVRGRSCAGIKHPAVKLTVPEVVAIRAEYKAGIKLCVLAKKFNVAHATVSDICHNRTWRIS